MAMKMMTCRDYIAWEVEQDMKQYKEELKSYGYMDLADFVLACEAKGYCSQKDAWKYAKEMDRPFFTEDDLKDLRHSVYRGEHASGYAAPFIGTSIGFGCYTSAGSRYSEALYEY